MSGWDLFSSFDDIEKEINKINPDYNNNYVMIYLSEYLNIVN
jgi:hypothetical protein